MPRIPEVDRAAVSPRVQAALDAQEAKWGAPLNNHLLYAHNEEVFRGARGMWSALDKAGLLRPALVAVINRRVAARVGCLF